MVLPVQLTGTVAVQTLTAGTLLTAWPVLVVEGEPAAVVQTGVLKGDMYLAHPCA